MNKEFIKACKQLEFNQKARQQYGEIVELGTTFCEDLMLYWFSDKTKSTHILAYNYIKGEYYDGK
jgi:hypothetical protein